jgi:NAD(P)-dependent dehydrogenase (short-subunit alcohol dehydrogenase family)
MLSRRGKLLAAGLALGLVGPNVYRRWREADLFGQTALVTGASRGLGFLLARELAREGCRVAICARDPDELETARRDLGAWGPDIMTVQCDVSNRDDVERMITAVETHFGALDILVNNAGVIQVGPVQAMTVEDFERSLGVMFWGTVYPTLAVLPHMRERRSGRIANITSIGGKVSVPHLLPYNSAKFAAVGFSEGLRAEVAGDGVTVTTVVPGLMRTGSYENALFKGKHEGEFTWFALGATLPGVSMDAERAARQVVRAIKRGDAEVTLTMPANLIQHFHGTFPGTTTNLLSLVDRVLPSDGQPELRRGMAIQNAIDSRALDAVTTLGRRAAERFHERPGPDPDAVHEPAA